VRVSGLRVRRSSPVPGFLSFLVSSLL
jgi:hypothetical protein